MVIIQHTAYRFSSRNLTTDYTQYLITPYIYPGDMELRFQYLGTRNMADVDIIVGVSQTTDDISAFDYSCLL